MKFNYWQKLEPKCVYHIYNRAIDGIDLYTDKKDYLFFLKNYKKYLAPYLDTYAYCLMPNHFHLLVKVKEENTINEYLLKEITNASKKLLDGEFTIDQFLSDQMRRMFSSYSLKTNRKYNRKGTLFSPKVKRVAIHEIDRVRYLTCYIHHNPIHHGFRKNYSDWTFSSFNTFNSNSPTLLSRESVLNYMGGNEGFKEMHELFQIVKMEEQVDEVYLAE